MKVKVESEKIGLKAQHSENEDHGIRSHHFMGNRWGNSRNRWKQCQTLFFWTSKLLQMVTAAMKLRRLLLGKKVMTNLSSAQSLSRVRLFATPWIAACQTSLSITSFQSSLINSSVLSLDSILKTRDLTLSTNVRLVKAMVFPVVMYGCESWTIKKGEHLRIDAFQ